MLSPSHQVWPVSRWGLALLAGNRYVKYSETTVKIRRIFLTIFDSSWLVNLAIDRFPAVKCWLTLKFVNWWMRVVALILSRDTWASLLPSSVLPGEPLDLTSHLALHKVAWIYNISYYLSFIQQSRLSQEIMQRQQEITRLASAMWWENIYNFLKWFGSETEILPRLTLAYFKVDFFFISPSTYLEHFNQARRHHNNPSKLCKTCQECREAGPLYKQWMAFDEN